MSIVHIESTRFGPIEVEEDLMFVFPRGLPGFENVSRFVIIERDGQPFKWLQCADDPLLAFLIADPHYFAPDYEAEVPQGELRVLSIRFPEDLAMAVIVNVPPAQPEKMTVNLRAPIIFNIRERLGLQIILTSSRYPVDYAVIREWRRKTVAIEARRRQNAEATAAAAEKTDDGATAVA